MSKNTRDHIVRAALSSFAAHGYDGTTLAQIAGMVGIQKPSIYNHFSGKDELFFTVAEKVMEELTTVMQESAAKNRAKPLEERIYLLLTDCTDFIFQEHEGMMYKRLMLFPPAVLAEDIRVLSQTGDQRIDEILDDLYDHGRQEGSLGDDVSHTVFRSAFYCLMDGIFTESFIYRDQDFQTRFAGAWEVFLRGISK